MFTVPTSLFSFGSIVLETHDPKTFAEASAHLDWDTTMNEEYCYLMENLSNVNGFTKLSMHQIEVLKDTRFD
jgi:hypothetical protein